MKLCKLLCSCIYVYSYIYLYGYIHLYICIYLRLTGVCQLYIYKFNLEHNQDEPTCSKKM